MRLMQPRETFVAGSAGDFVPDNNGDIWTDENLSTLARLVRNEGLSNATVATRLGRCKSSILAAISRYCVRDPKAKLRTCMPCKRPFFSAHNGNRICGRCKARNNWECN
jgi:hypothetical protein